jgi:hypothetical protein
MQKIFFQFINSNGRDMSGAFGITSFNDAPGWPTNYSTISIEYPFPQMKRNLKQNVCEYFKEIGIENQNFWWEN